MVNNNTPKNNSVTAVVTSESSIYLKRSELPKNLSSFRNDVGYISSNALDLWMKEHSYLSKDEITELIRKSNLTVIDSVNRTYDEDAISRLNEEIVSVKGEIVSIKDRLGKMDGDFISSDKERTFATKGDVRNINNRIDTVEETINSIHIDTSNFAEKSDIPTKVSELENDANYLTSHQSLTGYAKKSDLNTLATKSDLTDLAKKSDLTGLAKSTDLKEYATQEWVKDKGYITSQSLKNYARMSDLKDFATESFVVDLINSTEELDLSIYAKKTDLNKLNSTVTTLSSSLKSYAKKTDLNDYVKREELKVPSIDDLASMEWVESQGYLKEIKIPYEYVKKSDIKGMATKTWVNDLITELIGEDEPIEYAKIEDLPKDYVSTSSLNNILKKYAFSKDIPTLNGYAKEEWVRQLMSQIPGPSDLSGFVTESELKNYVSKTSLTNTLNRYARSSDLDGYATQEWVNNQHFISELEDMSKYALKSDISGYATQTWVKNNYLKKGSVYDKSESDSRYLKPEDVKQNYVSKIDLKKDYLTKDEIKNDYLKIEDYRGLREMVINQEILKDALVINGDYSSIDELQSNLNNLINGFYLISYTDDSDNEDHTDMYIVKNHKIISSIKDGVPQDTKIYWIQDPNDSNP